MLQNTFIHLANFGPRREKKLWSKGIRSWDEFLDYFGSSPFHKDWCRQVAASRHALGENDSAYFGSALPKNETWRCFPHFNNIAYLDIETTGLGHGTDHITVAGIYDGSKTHSYIHGRNLDQLRPDLDKYDTVITFNGSLFDIPFIRNEIPDVRIPPVHIDLRFVLQSLGVDGGLKKIEAKFGLKRDDDLAGLNGYDAVKMWKAFRKSNDEAILDRLVRYNSADISNLKILMEWAYKEKRKSTGFDVIRK